MKLELKIVEAVLDDLTDRRGLKQAWNAIDEDTRQEIKATWAMIVNAELEKGLE